jgi:hypothetical protein
MYHIIERINQSRFKIISRHFTSDYYDLLCVHRVLRDYKSVIGVSHPLMTKRYFYGVVSFVDILPTLLSLTKIYNA